MVVFGGGVKVEVGGGEGRTNFYDTGLLNKNPCAQTTASRFGLKGEILLYTGFSLTHLRSSAHPHIRTLSPHSGKDL